MWEDRLGVDPQVEHGGYAGGECLLECRGEVFGALDRCAEAAEGSGVGGEVGVDEVRAAGSIRVGAFLVHSDGCEHAVVDHHYDDRSVVLHRCGQFLGGHEEVAVAGEGNHWGFGAVQFGGHCGWHGVAHRPALGVPTGFRTA